jgi:hypothetical protein
METVIDNHDAPLTADDRRGVVTALVSTTSKIKSANINVKWAEKRLDKAEEDLKKAQDSKDAAQITQWEAEVERFKTQEALYKVTSDVLQKDERSQLQRIKDLVGDKTHTLGKRFFIYLNFIDL